MVNLYNISSLNIRVLERTICSSELTAIRFFEDSEILKTSICQACGNSMNKNIDNSKKLGIRYFKQDIFFTVMFAKKDLIQLTGHGFREIIFHFVRIYF